IGRRGEFIRPEQVAEGLEGSLRRLNTDRVEIYLLHGVLPDEYSYARDELVGELDKLREAGKIGYIGITEAFNTDRDHGTLRRAVDDGWPDVIMVGFNMLNQCARETIFPVTREKGIGVLDMFVVRQALHDPAMLRRTVERLIDAGSIPADGIDRDDPLGFVLGEGAAESLPDAAYRFCRDEHGVDVVLTGTGNVAHLEANIDAIERPPLPTEVRQRLVEMFDGVDCVSGQEPPLRESYSA
ncbi:MAG: aldo/keto reductase, partial [Planctomycetota bacterium]